jgi:O-antigen/teichoic acid export membrane protein
VQGLGFGVVSDEANSGERPDAAVQSLALGFLFYTTVIPIAVALPALLFSESLSRYWFHSDVYSVPLRWGILAPMLAAPANAIALLLQAQERFPRLAAQLVASALTMRILPCLVAVFGNRSFDTFLIWSAGGAAASLALSVFTLRGVFRPRKVRLPKLSEFWPVSRYFYSAGFLRYAATQLDQMVVAIVFPPATLAVYYVLRRFYSVAVLLIDSVADAMVPGLSRESTRDPEAARLVVGKWIRTGLLAGALGGAVLVAGAGSVLRILVGPDYTEAPFLLAALVVSALTYFLFQVGQSCSVLMHDPSRLLMLNFIAAGTNIAGILVFGNWLGLIGLPLAMIASSTAALEWANRNGILSWPRWQLAGAAVSIAVSAVAPRMVFLVIAVIGGLAIYRSFSVNSCSATTPQTP